MREEQKVLEMLISLRQTVEKMKDRVDGLCITDSELKNDMSWLSADISDVLSSLGTRTDKQESILLAGIGAQDKKDSGNLEQRIEALELRASLLRSSTECNTRRIEILEKSKEKRLC